MCKGLIFKCYTYIRLGVTRGYTLCSFIVSSYCNDDVGYVGSSDDINASDCSSSSDIFLIALCKKLSTIYIFFCLIEIYIYKTYSIVYSNNKHMLSI